MKAKWAVACAVPIFGVLFTLGNGCSGAGSQVKEFNRMDVGEGPGDVLTHLIRLQKEQGEQQTGAHPPPAAQGKGSGSGLPTSGGTGARHDMQPAATPMGDPSVPVGTAPHGGKSSPEKTIERPDRASSPAPPAAGSQTSMTKTTPPVVSREVSSPTLSGGNKENVVPQRGISPSTQQSVARKSSRTGDAENIGGPNYRIGPEDVLHIDVWGNEELTGEVTVRPDGKISMALIQDIQAEGRTSAELAGRIRDKLLAYIKNPNVSVIVREINAPKFSIIGYVAKPGTYPLRGDLTILQALSQAGGFTPFASPKKIKVIRYVSGKQKVRIVNYYNLIEEGEEGHYLLKSGDTIVVP